MRSKNNVENISFDMTSILLDIRCFWLNIVMCGLATAILIGCWFFAVEDKEYSSSTVFAVSSSSGNILTNASKANKVAETMTNILKSEEMNRIVVKGVGDVSYRTNAKYIADTNMISLTVTANSPKTSFLVLNSVLGNFSTLLEELMADVRIITIQKANVPIYANASYNLYMFIVIGFIFGCAACAGVIALLSILRDTVKNGDDMRNKVDARLLGTIPYLADKYILPDKSEVPLMTISYKNYWYQESFHLVAGRILHHAEKHDLKSIIYTSVFPNEGKTTSLLNTAISMSMNNKKVLVIDGDFRNPTISGILHVGEEYASSLADILSGGKMDFKNIWKMDGHNVYALTNARPHMDSVVSLSNGRFEELLKTAAKTFDIILVDSGPTAFVSDIELLKVRCDGIILIVAQDNAPVVAINDTIDTLDAEDKLIGCIYKETRKSRRRKPYGYNYYWKESNSKKDR